MAKSIEEIVKKFKDCKFYKGEIKENEMLSAHTTMKVGGPAALFLVPSSVDSAIRAVLMCIKYDIKYFILGNGSNIVFADDGFEGVVISTAALNGLSLSRSAKISPLKISYCPKIKESCPVKINCQCGVLIETLSGYCEENALLGLESFAGLPASIAGAAYMNARCYSVDAATLIDSVEYLDLDELRALERIKEFDENSEDKVECFIKMYHNIEGNEDWSYKVSPFTGKNVFISSVVLKAKCVFPELHENVKPDAEIRDFIHEENMKFLRDRESKGHFKAPSAGSVFKNNRNFGFPSGKLVDDAGLRGLSVGGAQIAPWHGNFIINNGNASASDIKSLVEIARSKVFENTGNKMECEILFI
ncbi:FAD-binding protein [Treponema sp.]|uniref:UDP-N-acetylmuramate dehydrogenase n=1 Tax=Treponema sp. TaxID=166 RepID=UPI0025E3CEEA|nr:FAD-binding protein [Treponema sp.]MCR5217210.1 FAD-binding protein [Treponema sp.]